MEKRRDKQNLFLLLNFIGEKEMNKKEKEARIRNHTCYWNLVDEIKEMSLNALSENLSVDDIISVLDRVRTILVQQEVIVTMEEAHNESDDEQEDDVAVGSQQAELKTLVPSVDPVKLMEEATRGMYG